MSLVFVSFHRFFHIFVPCEFVFVFSDTCMWVCRPPWDLRAGGGHTLGQNEAIALVGIWHHCVHLCVIFMFARLGVHFYPPTPDHGCIRPLCETGDGHSFVFLYLCICNCWSLAFDTCTRVWRPLKDLGMGTAMGRSVSRQSPLPPPPAEHAHTLQNVSNQDLGTDCIPNSLFFRN